MNFATYFTFEQFQQLTASYEQAFATDKYQPSPEHERLEAAAADSIVRFMADMRGAGALQPSDSLAERNRWVGAWNRFVRDPEDHYAADTCLVPLRLLVQRECLYARTADDQQMQNRHADLCVKFDSGSFGNWDFDGCSAEPCPATGEKLRPMLRDGWKPVLLKFSFEGNASGERFEVITDGIPEQQVLHVSIPVPSGNMIAADWFRFGDNLFTSAVDARSLDFDINYEFGRRAQTEYYAREFGFLSISVGNSSPSLLQRDGHLVLACETGDGDPVGKPLGSVCTDLWWATVIDEAVLRDLIARKHGDAGLTALEEYLAKDRNHFRFKAPQGTLHAYYSAGRKPLKEFTPEGIDFNRRNLRSVHGLFSSSEINWIANSPRPMPVAPTQSKKRSKP